MNILFNKAPIVHNYEDWVKGDRRALFVTGLSGSGKTTAAKSISDKTGAKLVSLDQYIRKLVRNNSTEELKTDSDYNNAYYKRAIELILRDNPDGKLVVEGTHIAWFDPEKIKKDHALMVLRTSLLNSTTNAIKRNLGKEHLAKWGKPNLDIPIKYNLQNYSGISNFAKRVDMS